MADLNEGLTLSWWQQEVGRLQSHLDALLDAVDELPLPFYSIHALADSIRKGNDE